MSLQSGISSDRVTVLLVDAGASSWNALEGILAKESFELLRATTGKKAVELAVERQPDLILLNVHLADMTGFQVCRMLRAKGVFSLVMLISTDANEDHAVVGLDSGADDFLPQPFSVRELVARMRAHLRRRSFRYMGETSRYHIGDCVVDFEKRSATLEDKVRPLTPREIQVLRLLVAHEGEIVDRNRIFDRVWGAGSPASTRVVDRYIVRLRQKIEGNPVHPRRIVSIYGKGYMLNA